MRISDWSSDVCSSDLSIVWFDAFVANVDRTARNTNLLLWHRKLHLIDHGAALYFHHDWASAGSAAASPFARIADHVLLPLATRLRERSEEHTSELQSLMRISYAVFCLKKKKKKRHSNT